MREIATPKKKSPHSSWAHAFIRLAEVLMVGV
jgi:hypothetical protein